MSENCPDAAGTSARIERIEERVGRVERDVSEMKTEQAETRIYVKQIFERIDDMKTMIAVHGKNNSHWFSFAKWILGGTIFIIVMYLFGGGDL